MNSGLHKRIEIRNFSNNYELIKHAQDWQMYPPIRRRTVPYVLAIARATLPRLLRVPPPQSSTWVWTGWMFIDWMRLVLRSSCQMGVDFKEDHATESLREVADVSTAEDTYRRV
jgi:hypothetical protein